MHSRTDNSQTVADPLPDGFREPLVAILQYWLGDDWMCTVGASLTMKGDCVFDHLVDQLMGGKPGVSVPGIHRDHLEFLRQQATRFMCRTLAGSLTRPDRGVVCRAVCCHAEAGAVLRLALPPAGADERNAWIGVESVFAFEEFSDKAQATRKGDTWEQWGVTQACLEKFGFTPEPELVTEEPGNSRTRELELSYSLNFPSPSLTPRF